ncbi:TetR/AcrR family transcriptional regulator [Amycolatopsis jiangsuensis]|uniref:AcrR family transcriptional regulator n=1 Tax=Amycolatopsis jiangsuensis TaxID=1181879 RepID=A0A840IQU7_9PSEU|nr:TetR/AcrR family transcriptional regulator C-terminal domain-containing protein [Amycolatopsis jiangsuensis]MBB4683548.1 AcrR family transcriptional regulator [Amycolatopsis jiangsuensis]
MGELVWERPEPAARPTPTPLSRDRIVATAGELADAGGLEAVSLRKVAAALGAGPMRLYGYLDTKEELLDLMVDAVYAEMPLPEPGTGWRAAFRALAHAFRSAALRHEWFADLIGGRPNLGPNALAYLEASMAAATELTIVDDVMVTVFTVHSFVTSAVRGEIGELRSARSTGLDEEAWQRASSQYLKRMFATGRYPTLERVLREADQADRDTVFAAGLDRVLNGLTR